MNKKRPMTLALGVAVGIVAGVAFDSALAQDETKKAFGNPQAAKLAKDKQNEPVVGPPKPFAKGVQANRGGKRRSIPKPTVVLKPGEIPKIEFDTPVYNFGRIRSGSDVRHDFWFTNTGNGPLEILRVKPS